MTESECLDRMVPPGKVRPGKQGGGVMQIWLTRACDKACFGCTQGSNLGGKPGMITVQQFYEACHSLRGYFGIVGIFGGNPAMHPQFEEICSIAREFFPQRQLGLWCNHPKGKGAAMRRTFNPAASNLNVHMDREAYDEFRRDWPECHPFGLDKDSRHSPVYVSMTDVGVPEPERWGLISNCDINQHWSAMIGVFRGQLRGYFCEIAGAMSMLHQHEPGYPDVGLPVTPGWWQRPMTDFKDQVRLCCHDCGVPLRGRGELAVTNPEGTEQVSATHHAVFKPKKPGRHVELVTLRTQLGATVAKTTDYLGNVSR